MVLPGQPHFSLNPSIGSVDGGCHLRQPTSLCFSWSCKMSELNEDILNYDEIGDIDADDTHLTGADEDELLLSDDESISGRLAANEAEDDLLSEQTESETQPERSIDFDSQTISNNASHSSDNKEKPTEIRANSPPAGRKSPCISPESDLVSSTNKEDEEISVQPTQSQSVCDQKDDEQSFAESDERSESTANEKSEVSYSQSEQTDNKSESTFVSQDASEETNTERTSDDYDPDDSEDVRERRNPKTTNEREMPHQFEDNSKPKNFSQNYQRNRHIRPQMPRQNHPYGGPGGPDFNPQFMPQFRGARRPMLPNSQPEFMRGHTISMMRGPPNHMQRMPPGMQPHPSRMPVGPGHLGPPHQRLSRPPFQTGPGMFGNNPGMPPQGMIRPRVPPNAHQMMPQRPPFGPYSQPNHPANMRLPMNPSMPPHVQPMNPAIPAQSLPLPLLNAPRKVLINPNFKGGVQAATNQLMLDTMKNSQIMENSREAELLRQQEAFINQNRMHIEKRRRSREHSPERDREYRDRDRERERSYSPPRRRERDARKPYPSSSRENRNRRADSRDREHPDAKKKRNDADGNVDKNDPKTEEDEETRAYRLMIEKQKAQREKILRDKEMRRRKAAEDLKKEEEKKVNVDEPLQKFTPIVVTEKKIISLKKKAADGPSDQPSKPKSITLARKVHTSSLSENSESGSQVKTVLRSSTTISKKIRIDDEEIDEDELLADSPPSTPAPIGDASMLKSRTNASKVGDIPTTMFTNRRVVVRNTDTVTNNENNLNANKATAGTGKGIFDRLDKKVISVNEAAKRKIQRIVINNSE
ncbi:histone-lysine N-methyltransferase, H3 lysine-79 specific [Sitodiplosis mosellana]|uniref:histone-lysine N-methyltransferase, H3 lysine-79 specific n=1 Tax=Sitodiplosis mosellana TaxID=263140 RepID=UPI00244521B8|nr:histone-lysine N-methyltransferase, H3 lysine-79 specific [Sitodiplosis mosellana]